MSEIDPSWLDEFSAVCQRAVNVWGETEQLRQLQEECGELVAAVSHYSRGRIDELGLADEIADVLIMCQQALLIVGARNVGKALHAKLNRLRGRVEAAEKQLELHA